MAETERLICASTALVEGGDGVRFQVDQWGKAVPAFAIRFRERVYAYLNQCSHVPVELDWDNGRFFDSSGLYLICATHGAMYAPESGFCVGGKCKGKRLTSLPVIERDGSIYLIEREQ